MSKITAEHLTCSAYVYTASRRSTSWCTTLKTSVASTALLIAPAGSAGLGSR
jgi:hypothetical protein